MSVYKVALTTQANILFVGGVRATLGTSATTLNNGEWFWSSNVLYYRSDAGNPDTVPLVIEVGQRANMDFGGKAATIQDITLQGSNSSTPAVKLNGIAGAIIQRCTVKDGAGIGIQIYGSQSGNSVLYTTVTGHKLSGIEIDTEGPNIISYCTIGDNGYSTTSAASGIGYTLGGTLVEYCTIYNNGQTAGGLSHGIYNDPNGTTAPVTCNYNTVYNHANGCGIKFSQSGIGTGNRCYGNNVAGIIVIAHAGTWNADYRLTRNVLYNNTGNGLECDPPTAGTFNMQFYHNTVYGNGGHGIVADTLLFASFVAENNVIIAAVGKRPFSFNTVPTASTINYNCIRMADGSALAFRWGASFPDLAGWQGFSNDVNSITTDPLFTNAGTADFTLTPASPAINAGVYVAGINDGYIGAAPDLGAFEFTTVIPPATLTLRERVATSGDQVVSSNLTLTLTGVVVKKDDLILLAMIGQEATPANYVVSNVLVDGVSPSIGLIKREGGSTVVTNVYAHRVSADGTISISCDNAGVSSGGRPRFLIAEVYYNTDGAAPLGTAVSTFSTGASTNLDQTITSAVGETAWAMCAWRNITITFAANTGTTIQSTAGRTSLSNTAANTYYASCTEAGAASVTVGGHTSATGVDISAVALSIKPATSTKAAMVTQPSGAISGSALTTQPVAQLQDTASVIVRESGVSVVASVASGSATLSGTTTVVTDADGLATFTDLVLTGYGAVTLQFTPSGKSAATSASFVVNVGMSVGAGAFTLTGKSVNLTTSGSLMSTTVLRNRNTTSGDQVVSGNLTLTITPVIVKKDDLVLLTMIGQEATPANYVVSNVLIEGGTPSLGLVKREAGSTVVTNVYAHRASADGSLTVSCDNSGVSSGGRPRWLIVEVYYNTDGAAPIGTAVSTFSTGASANLDQAITSAVGETAWAMCAWRSTPTFTAGTGTTIQSTGKKVSAVSAASDTSYASCTETGAASVTVGGTVSATGGDISAVAFSIKNATATKAAMVTQPSGAMTGIALTTQPAVRLQDASSVLVRQAGPNVVAAIASGTGALSGTTTVATDSEGVATFTDLVITGSGAHTLSFTPVGMSAATSASFTVSSAAPSSTGGKRTFRRRRIMSVIVRNRK